MVGENPLRQIENVDIHPDTSIDALPQYIQTGFDG